MELKLPEKYIPKYLSKKDRKLWAKEIRKTNRNYKNNKYSKRKNVKTYKHKKSSHINKLLKIYNMDKILDSKNEKTRFKTLSKKTGCSQEALNKIYAKGSAAWFSGSRPNQTQQSWAIARVASAVTGGKSSYIDRNELLSGCKKTSKALKMMKKTKPRKTRKTIVKL
jgi:hypothetical protein